MVAHAEALKQVEVLAVRRRTRWLQRDDTRGSRTRMARWRRGGAVVAHDRREERITPETQRGLGSAGAGLRALARGAHHGAQGREGRLRVAPAATDTQIYSVWVARVTRTR